MHFIIQIIVICWRSVLRKTVPEVLCTAQGHRLRAVHETEGTVYLNTGQPIARLANNVLSFSWYF